MRNLRDDITLYNYALGDLTLILQSMLASAKLLDQPDLAARATEALEVADAAADARASRALEDGQRAWTPRAVELDRAIDADVAYLYSVLSAVAARPAHPHVEVARRAMASLFPRGLRSFTQVRFNEQAILNTQLVDLLRGDGAALVTAMGLAEAVDALAARAAAFQSELAQGSPRRSSAQVTAAENAALEEALAVIHLVMGRWRPSDAAGCAIRDELLRPVVQVNQAIRERYQARHREAPAPCDPTSPVVPEVDAHVA